MPIAVWIANGEISQPRGFPDGNNNPRDRLMGSGACDGQPILKRQTSGLVELVDQARWSEAITS
jgi:hypothetical protein